MVSGVWIMIPSRWEEMPGRLWRIQILSLELADNDWYTTACSGQGALSKHKIIGVPSRWAFGGTAAIPLPLSNLPSLKR
jgi:hypothetical protein